MFAELRVEVEGAVEFEGTYTDGTLLDEMIEHYRQDSMETGYRVELYIQYHEHHPRYTECSCAQYVTSHHPTHVFERGGEVKDD